MDFFIGAYLLLSALFFFWLGKTVWTLQNTVQAQTSTIEAFRSLLGGMKTLLDSTDEPAMLKRMKAYREIVDYEMEAYKKKVDEEKRNALKTVAQGSVNTIGKLIKKDIELLYKVVNVCTRLMPYAPMETRIFEIESVDFGEHEEMKETLRKFAQNAPYTSEEDLKQNKRLAKLLGNIVLGLPPSTKED